ncbi:hypothetical protein FQN53_002769 [Emmonsiellopsis sp. PD_33]|nr:hypothetical protein FQN53_002769 [Emmonsiellopsis sp. PD_33]
MTSASDSYQAFYPPVRNHAGTPSPGRPAVSFRETAEDSVRLLNLSVSAYMPSKSLRAASVAPDLRVGMSKRRSLFPSLRIRRIKCDEAKPSCVRCTSTGRKCDGYAPEPLSKKELALVLETQSQQKLLSRRQNAASSFMPPAQPPVYPACADETERQYLDFFRSDTARISGGLFSPSFWEAVVLQISHTEPAIRHGIIALGALHKKIELEVAEGAGRPQAEATQERALYAMKHYGKAVGYAKKLLADAEAAHNRHEQANNRDVAFIACIIFVCYENLAGNYATATMHLRSGLRILEESDRRRRALNVTVMNGGGIDPSTTATGISPTSKAPPILPAPSPIQTAIDRLLRRLDLQAMSFYDIQDPYPEEKYLRFSAVEYEEPPPVPFDFVQGGMGEASSHLVDQIRWLFKLGEVLRALTHPDESDTESKSSSGNTSPYLDPSPLTADETIAQPVPEMKHIHSLLHRCEQHLNEWHLAYQRTLPSLSTQPYCIEHRTASVLQIYHTCALLMLQAGWSGRETAWDSFLPDIQDTMSLLEKLAICHRSKRASDEKPTEPFLLSLEIGIIFPLFFLGYKCRDPPTRQRAVAMLSSPPHMREGRWDSLAAAAMIKRVVEIEESESRKIYQREQMEGGMERDGESMDYLVLTGAEDIPEQARVHAVYPMVKIGERVVEVKFAMRPDLRKGWVMKKECIPF